MARILGLIAAAGLFAVGCATAPKTASGQSQLIRDADRTVEQMVARDPGLRPLLDQAAGYVVFPEIKQGGFVVGGGAGRGVVFEHGRQTGFAQLSQASVGAQVGGQKYSELVIARDRFALDQMKAGSFDLGAQAAAVAVRSGAASSTRFSADGIAVFVQPQKGAMLNVSLTGQRIKFTG